MAACEWIDEGFKEMLQKLASYDTFSMKEYKEVFIVVLFLRV